MDNDWRAVWQRRKHSGSSQFRLQDLIGLDGFDTGAGSINEADWRAYAAKAASVLGLRDGDGLYEVGCGAGAFLTALGEVVDLVVAGSDYSAALIEVAREAVPAGEFSELEASDVPVEPRFDVVVSNGVFMYFPDLDYAASVLETMVAKSVRSVAVLEVPNADTRDEAEAFRREAIGAKAYAQRYGGLRHLYIEPRWFRDQAARLGVSCEIVPSLIDNYEQGRFRFGSILRHDDDGQG